MEKVVETGGFLMDEGVAMSVMTEAATFGAVDVGMGAQIKARRIALGMSVKGLAERAGIDRGRLAALEEGATNVRDTTVGAIERALSQLEVEMGMDDSPLPDGAVRVGDPADDLVEFTVEGNFGVRAVVKGPIRDIDALQAAVAKLVAGMGNQSEPEK